MEVINVQNRDFSMKAKKLRAKGLVPGSVFGRSLSESLSIQMEKSVAQKINQNLREGSKLHLKLNGKNIPVQIKEKSLHPLSGEVQNINFQALAADEIVNSITHIMFVNDEKINGLVEKMLFEVPYSSLPADMIDTVTIDLEGMKPGVLITVKDIPELNSDKIELKIDPDLLVLRISEKRGAIVSDEEEEAAVEEAEA